MRYAETLTVPIVLDRHGGAPLHDQIADQLMTAIRAGSLSPGARMPSTRTLAALLEVSRGVAATCYDVLAARGLTEGRGGSGTYVVAHAARPARAAAVATAPATVDLTPGRGDAAIFPLAAWRAAWRQASCQPPPQDGPPALGSPWLRAAVADHLLRTRGLVLAGHEVVITGGAVPGLRLMLDVLAAGGETGRPRTVAVEDPGPAAWRAAAAGAGRRVLPAACDADGVRVADLPAGCLAAVLTTDGHLGLGRVVPARRRGELGAWSEATGATVLELACDAVFRPASSRLPRLLDGPGSTVLVGGLCDALTPALRLGYLVVPRPLLARVGAAVAARGEQPPHVTQLAVARLLADGTVTRLMHRRGLAQRHQSGIVREALARLRPAVTPAGQDAAGSVALVLPAGADAARLSGVLRDHGLVVPALDASTLLVGHGHLPDAELRGALTVLVRVLRAELAGGVAGLAA